MVINGIKYLEWKTEVVPLFENEEHADIRLRGCTCVIKDGKEYLPESDILDLIRVGYITD